MANTSNVQDREQRREQRQKLELVFIKKFIEKRCFGPTVREIQQYLVDDGRFRRTAISSIKEDLEEMEKKGWILLEYGISRGIRLPGYVCVPKEYVSKERFLG